MFFGAACVSSNKAKRYVSSITSKHGLSICGLWFLAMVNNKITIIL